MAQEDEDCMLCHGDPEAVTVSESGAELSLYVDGEVFANSLHGPLGCIGCHLDIEELPHPEELEPVACHNCHFEVGEMYAESLHGQALMNGDVDVASCSDCHAKHDIRLVADPLSPVSPKNLAETCGRCHADPSLAKRHMISVLDPSELYLKSVHGRAVNGDRDVHAATCADCHGAHTMLPSQDSASTINSQNIPATCGACHSEILDEFSDSIHGQALRAGIADAPDCTDCHGEHDIVEHDSAASPVASQAISRSTCIRCHNDERIMDRYGLETIRNASYMDSYHGIAIVGAEIVANCTSCHGVHGILGQDDPKSSVHPANLPQTCSACHENADEHFASGTVHTTATGNDQWMLELVRIGYLGLIAVVIGGMFLHNALLQRRHLITKFRLQRSMTGTHQRFTLGQRIGHGLLMLSFIGLTVSGFALRYPESWWAQLLLFGETGLALRSEIHRVAGVVMIVVLGVHFLHAVLTRAGRAELRAMIPGKKDLRDAICYMRYALNPKHGRPQFGRYNYMSKAEYWGLIWGSILMGITGLCMWYADWFLAYYPKIALDVIALIHFYEACLAALTIVVWHLYFVVFSPESYPMDWAWITGRITEEEQEEQHPLEETE